MYHRDVPEGVSRVVSEGVCGASTSPTMTIPSAADQLRHSWGYSIES